MISQKSVQGKEPWLAVSLSTIFPGFGQIYAGKISRGLLLIFIALILFGLSKWLILSPTLRLPSTPLRASRSGFAGSVRLGTLLEIGEYLLYFFNLFDAYRCTRKNNSREFERLRKSEKDPWLAVFLSRIVPGLGQIYGQTQWVSFILFFILISLVKPSGLSPKFYVYLQVAMRLLVVCLFSYHAYLSTPTHRKKSKRLIARICLLLLLVDLSSNIIRFSFREFVFDTHCITRSDHKSVPPSLKIGDCIVEEKISYHFTNPKRGDIVVFRTTDEMNQKKWNQTDVLIKRIIGLPHEKVEVRDGLVYINDKALNENYMVAEANDKWDLEVIADDTYFVFGSNRYRLPFSYSYDNHILVTRDLIIGKATKINWPPKRMGIIK